eukprot:TRINITY_DN19436_c0_g1_i1.p1 TRINITY_DN19436_c0_g1~~TRINITY_DN19436_c0_g1_i1.p1  ORF type:complete len:1092 (+),score=274.98 TRINITY_DN19436_c0_g1_i1:91-3366(+)
MPPSRSSSAPQLLPRLSSSAENPRGSERIVKAEEHMYVQVRRGHWPELSPDCKLWTLRDFALQHSSWESFTDKGKLRVLFELGSLLSDSGDKLSEDAVIKAKSELQSTVEEVRQLPRVVRADKPRASAVAQLCESSLNLPGAARRLKEALGASKQEEYDNSLLKNCAKKFKFRGYIDGTEHRAITVPQLRRVIKYCQENHHLWRDKIHVDSEKRASSPVPSSMLGAQAWTSAPSSRLLTMEALNLYHVDSWLIWPATETSRCAFVELMAEQAQPAVWCVSHCWGQPHASFVACVEQHMLIRGLNRSAGFWIWAYAHRHHGAVPESPDPRQSSFCKALDFTECRLLLVLQDVNSNSAPGYAAGPFGRIWCMFEVLQSLDRSIAQGMARAPIDVAVCQGDQAQVLTFGLTEKEQATEERFPGTGEAEKANREKAFPVSIVEHSLKNCVELAQASKEEDRTHLLNAVTGCKAPEINKPCPEQHDLYDRANARLNGLFALLFLRKVSEDRDPDVVDDPGLAGLKEAVASALRMDVERTEINVSLGGGGGGPAVNEALFLLVQNLPERLQKLSLDMQGSGLKNASLAELANHLSPELEDITIDLQCCRGINDNGLKRFMDNFIENCEDRSKLKTVSCLLLGTKVEQGCQEACEILDLDQIQQVRKDLELQERKNYIKRLMKNVSQGKAAIASLRKLLEKDTEVSVRGALGEMGKMDVSHVEWNIHSRDMEIMLDKALLKVLLDSGAAFELRKRPDAAVYCTVWQVQPPSPNQTHFEVNHRHRAFNQDKFAETMTKVQVPGEPGFPWGKKAIADTLLEVRGGDLVRATVPMADDSLKLAMIYAAREGKVQPIGELLKNSSAEQRKKWLGEADEAVWDEEDLENCALRPEQAPSGSALMGASENGHHEVVQKLVDWGADVHAKHHETEGTALTAAAAKGRLEVANILFECDAEEETRDATGRTPLSWAAGNGHLSVVQALLEREINIDLADRKGLTPLMHAAGAGQVAIVKLLIEYNANIRAVDKEEKTAAAHATIYDSDKLGVQQKKQKVLEALAHGEKELVAAEEKAAQAAEEEAQAAAQAAQNAAESAAVAEPEG